ncbi:NUDIX hydrolase [Streptomyces sp. NPDC056254]|uniref:NUDIX hydrolase n=1 Tax=Streptomyces sp. NPDC056254 TaxID=3345763 RepID=UPI0035DB0B0E
MRGRTCTDAPAPVGALPPRSRDVWDVSSVPFVPSLAGRGNEMWALPGGKMELGESIADCAIRETLEEAGISVEIVGIVGTYTNPGHVFAYDDGEVRQEFSICLLAQPTGGSLRTSDESHEVAWFAPEDTDDLQMVPSIRKRIDDWRAGRGPVVR